MVRSRALARRLEPSATALDPSFETRPNGRSSSDERNSARAGMKKQKTRPKHRPGF